MANNRVPKIVKHMTVAIFRKGGIDGSTQQERFISAWNIARARLTEYGHLSKGSEKGPASNIRLTGSGKKLETKHIREGGRKAKENFFDNLYSAIEDEELQGRDE